MVLPFSSTDCDVSWTLQATPRSLRSFFDSTPSELLDSQLSSLALISRTTYERNLAEIAALRKQIEDKDSEISTLIVKHNGVGDGGGAVRAAAEIGALEVRISELQKRNEGLVGENERMAKELEGSELKGKAIKAEISRLRLDGSKRAKEFEEKNLGLAAELLDVRTSFSQLQQSISSNGGITNGRGTEPTMAAESELAALRTLRSENERLLNRLRSFESGNADLQRINKELRTVVKTNENSNVNLQKENLDLKVQISRLESDNQVLQKKEAKFDMMVEEKERLETLVARQRADIEKLRAVPPVNNIRALEAEIVQLQSQLANSNSDFRRVSEAANKRLVDDNIELTRKCDGLTEEKNNLAKQFEVEKTKLVGAHNDKIESLNEHSKRLLNDLNDKNERLIGENVALRGENVVLRGNKERLIADLDDMERDLRIYQGKAAEGRIPRAPLDKPFEPVKGQGVWRNSGMDSDNSYNQSTRNSISPRARGLKRPFDDMEDSKQEGGGDGSYHGNGNGNGNSRNFNIRAIASQANGSIPASGITKSPTQASNSIATSPAGGRTIFDRVGTASLPSRSLFDRISHPPVSPIPRGSEDREIEYLLNSAKTGRRCIICRFSDRAPALDEFLSIVCGGPLESLRTCRNPSTGHNPGMGIICFLRPHHAEEFLAYAERHLNNKHVFPGSSPCTVEFEWLDKAIRPIDRDTAFNVIHFGRSRIFKFYCIPYEVSTERCLTRITGLIGDRGFWVNEGNRSQRGREVEVEFLSIRDANEAKRLLEDTLAPSWGGIAWCREECDRSVPR